MIIVLFVALTVAHYCVKKDLFVHIHHKSIGYPKTKKPTLNECGDELFP